jgi:hypothetical protein
MHVWSIRLLRVFLGGTVGHPLREGERRNASRLRPEEITSIVWLKLTRSILIHDGEKDA